MWGALLNMGWRTVKLGDALAADRWRGPPARAGVLALALAGLLVLTVLAPLMTATGGALTGEGSPVRQGAYVALLLLAVIGIRPTDNPRRLLAVPLGILIALAWCWLSVTWAVDPGIAVRRLTLTTIIIWSGFITVDQLGYERSVLLVRAVLAAALVANFLAVLTVPAFGIHQTDELYDKALVGDWRGIMTHKNFAGAICALTVIAWLFDARRLPRWLQVAVIGAAIVFLVFSGSRTSLGTCAAAVALGMLYQGYHARYRLFALGTLCIGMLVAALYVNVFNDLLLRNLSDRTAFTGRTQIWNTLLGYAADHPLTGAGYDSFWNIGPASPIYRYGTGWVTKIAAGHNGFLDLLVTIGWPGLAIVIGGVVVWPLVRLLSHPAGSGSRGALVAATIMFCVSHNFTETTLFDRDATGQVFLMVAIALLWSITAPVRRSGLDLGPRIRVPRGPVPSQVGAA